MKRLLICYKLSLKIKKENEEKKKQNIIPIFGTQNQKQLFTMQIFIMFLNQSIV